MSNRHLARTIAMQTLFAWDFNGKKNDDVDALVDENFANFAPQFDDGGFVRETIKNILEHSEEIDNYIRRYATEWPLEQLLWLTVMCSGLVFTNYYIQPISRLESPLMRRLKLPRLLAENLPASLSMAF